jgi:hypothetical protein
MAEGPARRGPPSPQFDLQQTARDWITIWQSELAAMGTDREAAEAWVRLVGLWAAQARAAADFLPRAPDGPAGHAAAGPPAGPPPADAAPDPRDTAIDRLAERVAELERTLSKFSATRLDEPGKPG